jgi:hypothetical protein
VNTETMQWLVDLFTPHLSSAAAAVTVLLLLLFFFYEFRRWTDR